MVQLSALLFALAVVGGMVLIALGIARFISWLMPYQPRKPKPITVWLTPAQRAAMDKESLTTDMLEQMHQIAQDEAIGIAMWSDAINRKK